LKATPRSLTCPALVYDNEHYYDDVYWCDLDVDDLDPSMHEPSMHRRRRTAKP
jgi:hypothetical protein